MQTAYTGMRAIAIWRFRVWCFTPSAVKTYGCMSARRRGEHEHAVRSTNNKESAMAKATSKRVAVREVRVAVGNVGFEEMVKILREVWKVPGVGGCDPCRSGLDKFIIEDIEQRFG